MAIVLMAAIPISCNKEENLVTDPSSPQQLKNGEVFTVSPSGNYEDDSYNIQTALNDAVAGKQVTIVTTHDKIDWSIPSYANCMGLITFRHGYVRMSDLTFKITDPEPVINTDDDERLQGATKRLPIVCFRAQYAVYPTIWIIIQPG